MKHTKKLTIFSIAVLCSLLLSLVVPIGALADDATPPPVETPVVLPPTEELVATDAPIATEEPLATETPVATEIVPTEPAVIEVPVTEQAPVIDGASEVNVAEIVAAADENDVLLADASGEPLTLGSQEASDLLSMGDPFFWDGDSWEGYTKTGTGCPTNVVCHQSDTPFQAAVNLAPAGSTVYVAGGNKANNPTDYQEPVTINTANLSFQGYNTIAVSANSNTPTSMTSGFATTTSFTLNAVFGTTSGVFAPTVYVNPNGKIQDGVDLVAAGGTVIVAPGTYQENVTINDTKNGIKISGNPGADKVAGAAWNAPVLNGANLGGTGFDVTAGNVTLVGLFIENYDTGIRLHASGNSNFTAENNTIQGNGIGVFNENAVPGVILHYNIFTNNDLAIKNNPDTQGGLQYIEAQNNYWGCTAGPVVQHTYKDSNNVEHTDYYQWSPSGQDTAQPIPGFDPAQSDCELLFSDKEQSWNLSAFDWSPYKIKLGTIETTTEGCPPGYTGTYPNCVAPVLDAVNDSGTTNENTPVTTNVLSNDSLGVTPTSITGHTNGANGTVSCSGSECTYTPNAGFTGTDSYTYTITDSQSLSDTATVTITVSNLPDAINDSATTNEGVAVTTDVLANDDLGTPPTAITSNTQGSNGTVNCSGSQCTYTPNPGFSGTDSYTYTITDSRGNFDTATVTVTIVNLPDAIDDSGTTNEGVSVTTNVLANDDLGTEPTTITSNTQGANGTVSCSGSQCTYTPNPGFSGTDSYTYTITDSQGNIDTATVTITVVNLPDAINDSDTTNENTSVTTSVLANDDLGIEPTTITSNSQGTNGTVSCNGTQCTYTPSTGFIGTDSYTYTITDSKGNTDTATVTITVSNLPDAIDDSATTNEGVAVTTDVLANDDLGVLPTTITGNTNGTNGTVSCSGSQCTYTPNASFTGTDSYTYTITDSNGQTDTATVTVTVVNLPDAINDSAATNEGVAVTTNVLANDDLGTQPTTITANSQGTNGTVSCLGSQCTYTPNAGFYGTDSYSYTITDSRGNTDTAIVTVTVVNLPDAINDSATTNEGASVTTNVLANDDLGTQPTTITANTQGTNGTVSCSGAQCTYTPNAGFSGTDSYTYTITDSKGNTDTATVTITVVNLPDAINDSGATNENTPVITNVLANDDLGTQPTSITANTQGANGAVTCTATQCTYTPKAGFSGTDSYTYTITDSNKNGDTATVTIIVSNLPHAIDDSATTNEGVAVTTDVLANDGLGVPPTAITSNSQGANGTVSCTTTQCTYTPNAGFTGTDSYTYTITDSKGNPSTATVTVTVINLPDAVNDNGTTIANTPVTTNVLTNDDLGTPATSITGHTNGTSGTVSCTGTQCTYTPNAGFTGTDSYTYTITDSKGNTDSATVTVTVSIQPVRGCTDPAALNYNPNANVDDGSCIAVGPGCTDRTALNYNPLANVDDGSCSYPVPVTAPSTPGARLVPFTGFLPVTGGEVHAIAAGIAHTCAITPEGGVQCWGNNDFGQLGNATNTASNVPVDVVGINGGMTIVAGGNHTCVLSSGEIWCWGQNSQGQLGDGTRTDRNVPVKVLSDAADITAGLDYTCAVMNNGQVMCWGNNDQGQLADGTKTDRPAPTLAALISGVSNVDAGQNKSCGLTETGLLKCVTDGAPREIGGQPESSLNVAVNRFSSLVMALMNGGIPVAFQAGRFKEINSVHGATDVDSGLGYVCTLIGDGTVKCWGSNFYGQLGRDSLTSSSDPGPVLGVSSAWQLAVGKYHACVMITTNASGASDIQCWGLNNDGQLGNGTNVNSSVPVFVK